MLFHMFLHPRKQKDGVKKIDIYWYKAQTTAYHTWSGRMLLTAEARV